MRLRYRVLNVAGVSALLVGLVGCTTSPPGQPDAVGGTIHGATGQQLADQLARQTVPTYQHFNRIWPDAKFGDLPILFSDTKRAWLIDPRAPKKDSVAPSDLSRWTDAGITLPEGAPYFYNLDRYEGKPIMVVQYKPDSPVAGGFENGLLSTPAIFAVHEGFHLAYQREAVGDTATAPSSRSDAYPTAVDARVARSMMITRLRDAIQERESRSEHLAEAAYWWNEWQRLAPDERQRFTEWENFEGLARYTELMVGARLLGGWDTEIPKLEPRIVEAIDRYYGSDSLEKLLSTVSADAESYEAGALAALLLDLRGKGWKDAAMSGNSESPVEVLLKNIRAVRSAAPDKAVTGYVKKAAAASDSAAGAAIDPLMAALRDSAVPLVVFPADTAGSFVQLGEHRVGAGADAVTVARGVDMNGLVHAPNLRIANGTVFQNLPSAAACGDNDHTFAVPAPNLTIAGSTATLADFGVVGTAQVTTQQAEGRTIYCVTG